MASGIYKVVNAINNKFYIGSTTRLSARKAEHRYKAKCKMGNSIIRNAVLKYGEENFKFEILERLEFGTWADKNYIDDLLSCREQYYVDTLKPEYNIRIKDVTRCTNVCSDKQREHLRRIAKIPRDPKTYIERGLINRGKYKGENNKKSIEIDIYKRETLEFVQTIKGIRECGRIYNIDCSYLTQLCKVGYSPRYKREYVFCYHGDDVRKLSRPFDRGFHFQRADAVPILQIDKNGNVIKEWRSGNDAEKEIGLYKGSISRVISGEYSHTKNFRFKLKTENHGCKV
jgi:hypothetical protein